MSAASASDSDLFNGVFAITRNPMYLAMTLFCIGFGGKLMTEAIEAIRKDPVEAIRASIEACC